MFNILITFILLYLSRLTIKPKKKWHARPAKTQNNLGIRPFWSESSLSTWGKLKSLAIIRAQSEAPDQTGWMPRLIWVFARRKGHFVGFVMRRLILLCLICVGNTDFCYFQAFLFPETLRESLGFYVSMHIYVSVYYVILQTSSNTHLYLSRRSTLYASHCSYSLLVGPRGDVRVVSLMVNDYADIYKDNTRKKIRKHTIEEV